LITLYIAGMATKWAEIFV